MANRILLILPPDSRVYCAKTTLEDVENPSYARDGLKPPGNFMRSISLNLRGRTSASRVAPSSKIVEIHRHAKSVPPWRWHVACNLRGSGSYSAAGFFPGLSYTLNFDRCSVRIPRGRWRTTPRGCIRPLRSARSGGGGRCSEEPCGLPGALMAFSGVTYLVLGAQRGAWCRSISNQPMPQKARAYCIV